MVQGGNPPLSRVKHGGRDDELGLRGRTGKTTREISTILDGSN